MSSRLMTLLPLDLLDDYGPTDVTSLPGHLLILVDFFVSYVTLLGTVGSCVFVQANFLAMRLSRSPVVDVPSFPSTWYLYRLSHLA